MAVQTVRKLCRDISDDVCPYCPNYWAGECGAFPALSSTRALKLIQTTPSACRPLDTAASVYQLPLWS